MYNFDPDLEEWSPEADYWVRFAPVQPNMKTYTILGFGKITSTQEWVVCKGDVAKHLAYTTTSGYSVTIAERLGRGRYKLAFDVARNPEEATAIERWYQRNVEVERPGTIARPNALKRLTPKSIEARQRLVERQELPELNPAVPVENPPPPPMPSLGTPAKLSPPALAESAPKAKRGRGRPRKGDSASK
jgi:hypothetical protein